MTLPQDPDVLKAALETPLKPGMPLEVAKLLVNALNLALTGKMPMLTLMEALECLAEARRFGVEAKIDYEPSPPSPHPGRYVLIVDGIKVVIERSHARASQRDDEHHEIMSRIKRGIERQMGMAPFLLGVGK